jgi:hypothetical protein
MAAALGLHDDVSSNDEVFLPVELLLGTGLMILAAAYAET